MSLERHQRNVLQDCIKTESTYWRRRKRHCITGTVKQLFQVVLHTKIVRPK